MKAERPAEQLYFLTCHIRTVVPGGTGQGTGFFYAVPVKEGGVAIYVVTNKHVVQGASLATLTFLRSDGDEPLEGQTIDLHVPMTPVSPWIGHPDPEIDIAILSIAADLERLHEEGTPVMFRAVGPDDSYGRDLSEYVSPLEGVVFVGYPSGIYDTHNFLPIARQGTTATPVSENYQGKPTFLIDASVFPGSSGSPVCILNQNGYSSGDAFVIGGRFLFLGVLAAVHTRVLNGKVEVVPTSLVASVDEPIDLGIVYKASTVDDLVAQQLDAAGLHRAARQLPEDPTPEQDGPRP